MVSKVTKNSHLNVHATRAKTSQPTKWLAHHYLHTVITTQQNAFSVYLMFSSLTSKKYSEKLNECRNSTIRVQGAAALTLSFASWTQWLIANWISLSLFIYRIYPNCRHSSSSIQLPRKKTLDFFAMHTPHATNKIAFEKWYKFKSHCVSSKCSITLDNLFMYFFHHLFGSQIRSLWTKKNRISRKCLLILLPGEQWARMIGVVIHVNVYSACRPLHWLHDVIWPELERNVILIALCVCGITFQIYYTKERKTRIAQSFGIFFARHFSQE